MYYIQKTVKIRASNYLDLSYESKDKNNREYTYEITVRCKGETLNSDGMLVDTNSIVKSIEKLNHTNLNEVIPFNPTVENLAKYICHLIPFCYRVDISTGDDDSVTYIRERQAKHQKEEYNMKIEVSLEKIKGLVTKAYKGVSNNRLAPITSLLGLEFSPDGLTIRTFDGENHVVVRDAEVKTAEPSNITIDANVFKNLMDKVTTKEVSLEIKDRYLEVNANGTYKIEIVYDDNQVLVMKNVDHDLDDAESFTIDRKVLEAALDYNEVSAAKTTEVLFETGAFVGAKIITTDEVLATVTHKELVKGKEYLFKYSSLHLISVFNKDELTFKVRGKDFYLTDGVNAVRGVFLDGVEEYPKSELLDLVLGGDQQLFVVAKTAELVNILDRLSIFVTPYDNDKVDFEFNEDGLCIRSNQSKAVENILVDCETPIQPQKLALSLTPLKLQLNTIKDEEVKLYYGSEASLRIGTKEADYLIATTQVEE